MAKNTGIPYETLTQQIFDQILNQKSVKTIDIQHDVILQGKTTSHQIDVYWEFDKGGITYYTIVQAKDWNSKVEQGELLKFKAVLDDLPNQPRGIFVTRTGYQKGAKEFADKNGIVLYELREPTEEDKEGRIETIIINLFAFTPHSTSLNLIPDSIWAKEERKRLGIADNDKFSISIRGREDNIIFYNEKDEEVGSVHSIVSSFFPSGFQELPPTKTKKDFTEPTYLHTGVERFPKLKFNALEATISILKSVDVIQVGGENIVAFILKNITDDTEHRFDQDIKLIK